MAAPVDASHVATNISTGATSHTINVGSPAAGTLLILVVRINNNTGSITPTGFTTLANDNSDAAANKTEIFYKWADGTEGATISMTTGNAFKLATICWGITGAENPATSLPQVSTISTFTTTANTADPSSVAPAGAPRDTLYIAWAGEDGEVGAFTAAPSGYSNLTVGNSGTGGNPNSNILMGGATKQATSSSSDDPGTFTHAAAATGGSAYTIAVRAASGSALTASPADTLTLADARTVARGSAPADALALADARTFARGQVRADTVALSDSVSSAKSAPKALADTVALGDAITITRVQDRAGDTVTLSDSISPVKTGGGTQAVNDTVALSDALTTAVAKPRSITDTVALTDSITALSTKTVSISDSVVLADAFSRLATYVRTPADAVALADLLLSAAGTTRSFSDQVDISDAQSIFNGVITILRDPIYTGHIGEALVGMIDGRENGHVSDTVAGTIEEVNEEVLV